jgi:small basic protein (TIGR04137 family)
MSIDKSLRRKNTLERARNVLTRGERIRTLQKEERWQDGRSPYGLPKVRVHRIVIKKAKKAKEEEKPAGEEGAAAPAAAAAAAPAGEKKAPEKKAGDKKGGEKK